MRTVPTYSKLLSRQIRKHFGSQDNVPENLHAFLNMIDNSYEHYEQNHKFLQHTVEISSTELSETNAKLLEDTQKQKSILLALKKTVQDLSSSNKSSGQDEDDVLSIIDVLQAEIHNRKVAESKIQLSEIKYRGIIENLSLGMIETDRNGMVTKAYPQFLEMTGFSEKELLGRNPLDVFGTDKLKSQISSLLEKRKQGLSSAYETVIKHKDGSLIWVLISEAPITDVQGKVVGSIGLHFNISDRKAMESDLIHAREGAEAALQAREQFLTNISHEIRTPMNAIIGMSSLLGSTPLNEKQKQYQSSITMAATNLMVIINDLLDLSKMSAGKFKVEKLPFKLDEVLHQVQKTIEFKTEEKGLQFNIRRDKNASMWFLGDPIRLNQVLVNLIGNSVKFTSTGGIAVDVELLSESNASQRLRFSVEDTGTGIETAKLESIFESFTQEDETISSNFGGTGLGLTISRQLVNLFGGKIQVESEKGKGSRFFFDIDLELSEAPAELLDASHDVDHSNMKGMRFLLVEDNEMNRLVARAVLKQWDVELTECENGQEAVDLIKQENYDIVLMDMQMPVLGGIGATKIIREELNSTIPIIALTANALQSESLKCKEAGMDAYLCKPYHREELLKVVHLANLCNPASIELNQKRIKAFIEESENKEEAENVFQEVVARLKKEVEFFGKAVEETDFTQASVSSRKIRMTLEPLGMTGLVNSLKWFEISVLNRSDLFAPMNAVFIATLLKKALKLLQQG